VLVLNVLVPMRNRRRLLAAIDRRARRARRT
jgi:heme exporter protein D